MRWILFPEAQLTVLQQRGSAVFPPGTAHGVIGERPTKEATQRTEACHIKSMPHQVGGRPLGEIGAGL